MVKINEIKYNRIAHLNLFDLSVKLKISSTHEIIHVEMNKRKNIAADQIFSVGEL